MRYQLPQYLEVEDRIFGPFTLKQFLFVGGGVGGAYAAWAILPSPLGVIAAILIVGLCGALGFGQMNGRPFLSMVENMVSYAFARKLYLWKKVPHAVDPKKEAEAPAAAIAVPRLSDSRLKDLAWGLDLQETLASGAGPAPSNEPPKTSSQRVPTIPAGIV